MSTFRYGDGSPLTRGEFVAVMQRVEGKLDGVDERVAAIEERLRRPRMIAVDTAKRVSLLVIGMAVAVAASYFGLPTPF